MSNYPIIKIHTCNETVTDAEFVDVNFATVGFLKSPTITVTLDSDDINYFISNLTSASVRINFSTKYTGTVRYSAITIK